MVEVVNVVAGGDIGRELDLEILSDDLDELVYHSENGEIALHVHIEKNSPLIMFYRTGKYTITGIKSQSDVEPVKKSMVEILTKIGVIDEDPNIKVYNIVCKGSLNFNVDLSNVAYILGLENTEYEPEQSPFLVYRPEDYDCVITISSSGESVINGVTSKNAAEQAFQSMKASLESK